VLLAEDDEIVRETVADALRWRGYVVTPAGTAPEAVSAVRSHHFDAVISSGMLPGGGARQVLSGLRELRDPPPVLVVSEGSDEELVAELSNLGADSFISKPFGMFDLLAALARLTGESEA
jgi:DNA-binding response OmpR family regulator